MTRERAKELLPIIQAYAEGKKIQSLSSAGWEDINDPLFRSHSEYRIKPEPREWYEIVPKGGTMRTAGARPNKTVAEALMQLHDFILPENYEIVQVREAIDEQ